MFFRPRIVRFMRPLAACLFALAIGAAHAAAAETRTFVHPGGLHSLADLERMKAKVAARETPWIEGWDALLRDPLARADYRSGAQKNIGASRQRASRDAHAAYLNFIRWYVGGDRAHAAAAIRICNEWSAAVDQEPAGADIPGLNGIFTAEFSMVGELLRSCPDWRPEDRTRFETMVRAWLYPSVSRFLAERNRRGDSHFWANWDIANIEALLAIGVLLDDRAIFDEGVEYFKNGRGTGSILHAIYQLHPGGLGQWQESGRDQPHGQLGVGMLAQSCQIAWNQGVDLFGYSENRLLAGAEYVARSALSLPVPYRAYTNSSDAKNHWLSNHTLGRFSAPVWELLYNHYVVRRGLNAPHVAALARLSRPENGGGDHFGYGTLAFTLDAAASPYPPAAPVVAPAGLVATPGLERVYLSWNPAPAMDAAGYLVRRAPAEGGAFETIAEWSGNTAPRYTDRKAAPGVAYRYDVQALNRGGVGPASSPVVATAGRAGPLPEGWRALALGSPSSKASPPSAPAAGYSVEGSHTLTLVGLPGGLGDDTDAGAFALRPARGDLVFTARLAEPPPDEIGRSGLSALGLVMRESAAPEARGVALTLGEAGLRGTRARFRAERGSSPSVSRGNDYTWAPVWFRLARRGDVFTASHSVDGKTWFEVGSAKIALPADYLLGVVVCASSSSKPGRGLFEQVDVAPATRD